MKPISPTEVIAGVACLLGLFLTTPSHTPTPADERAWCDCLAEQLDAETEVVLWDGSRCDLVTDSEAIEVEWAANWPEAIGQAQYYGLVLRKRPAVVLLVKNGEERFAWRCQAVCARLGMAMYVEKVP